ncbi:glycosyltransferase family 4 protein [Lactobacillus crispatus]|uniref:glycosyltransferase family 4 protein n=1 Tax=Lactobacillus crispatus TaxID=47770 RepID=UPI0022E746B4|nr:glycosyltransferase family 4 protein [Lactobacillus crispatus]
MRIAMLGQKKVPSRLGGVEVVVENLALRMVKRDNQVTLYNRKLSGDKSGKTKDYKGVVIRTVPTINVKGLAAFSSAFFATLFASVRNNQVIHIHAEGPAYFCWIPKIFKKKVVVTIHGLDWKRDKWGKGIARHIIKVGEKNAVRFADQIIVLDDNTKQYFLDTYNKRTIVIPNGVSKPTLRPPKIIKQRWCLDFGTYFLFLGRLVPEKGLVNLITAFKKLKTNKKLVIAGGTSDTTEFVKKLKQLSKSDPRIIFTGPVKNEMLDELYTNAYTYVLPSNLEGMPLTILEALSYGNCVLTSDIPECKNVIDNHGFIFDHRSWEDLKLKLEYIEANPNVVDNLKKGSASFILNKYNWDNVVDKTLKVYEE